MLTHPLPGYPTPRNGQFGAARGWIGGVDYGTHNGHDWSAPSGTPIVAAGGGRVVHSAGSFCPVHIGAGNHIHIEHGGGIETRYAHMLNRLVATGQFVEAGQVIGGVGASGTATGAHLHFSVLVNGQYVDPVPHLGGAAVTAGQRAPSTPALLALSVQGEDPCGGMPADGSRPPMAKDANGLDYFPTVACCKPGWVARPSGQIQMPRCFPADQQPGLGPALEALPGWLSEAALGGLVNIGILVVSAVLVYKGVSTALRS